MLVLYNQVSLYRVAVIVNIAIDHGQSLACRVQLIPMGRGIRNLLLGSDATCQSSRLRVAVESGSLVELEPKPSTKDTRISRATSGQLTVHGLRPWSLGGT